MREDFLAPISYSQDEGLDDVQEGNNQESELDMLTLRAGDFQPNYCATSLRRGVTAPILEKEVMAMEGKATILARDAIETLGIAALKVGQARDINGWQGTHSLTVYRGFVSPRGQQMRWKDLYDTRKKNNPMEEIETGDYADRVGSVAECIKDDNYEKELNNLLKDTSLVSALKEAFGKEDITEELEKLLKYRANNGELEGVEMDINTAATVHNFGQSVNVGLAKNQSTRTGRGFQHNMGVGLDMLSPAQAVDYFEHVTPEQYIALVEQDPMLGAYLESLGVKRIDQALIDEIKRNRRVMHNTMTGSGFDFYRGEIGHYTKVPKSGTFPNKERVYAQAQKFGY
jgi:D-alanyl-D-alanine dipeptidase